MAKKPNITTIASGYYSRLKLNENFENLQNGFDNTLSLDGSTPNAMGADLDFNNNNAVNIASLDAQTLTLGGSSVNLSDIQSLTNIAQDIQTLADIEDGTDATDAIQTAASVSSDIAVVSGISTDVTTVSSDSADVQTLADVEDGTVALNAISTLGPISTDITTVSGISSDVTTVAADGTDIGVVAGISSDVTAVSGINTDVTTVSGISSDVTAVSNIDTNVTTVAGIDTDVTTVSGVSSDVTTVAGIDTDVTTVSGISADVTTVAADGTDIGAVAGISNDVTTVATNIADVSTVSGISADVTAVSGISSDVTTVAADGTDIGTVAGISSDVTTVAADGADIGTVAGISDDVSTVSGISANVTTVSGISSDVTTVAANVSDVTNFADVYLGPAASDPATRNDGSALQEGDLYFSTTSDEMRVYEGSSWTAAFVSLSGALLSSNNLSDVDDPAVSLSNLGLTATAADLNKTTGIEANADVTDTANVTAAGALMDSELTSEASVKALDQGVATTDSPDFAGLSVDTDTLYVDSANNRVGIGASSPATTFHASRNYSAPTGGINSQTAGIISNTSNNCYFSILSGTGNISALFFGDTDSETQGRVFYSHSSDSMAFYTSNSEAMRIDSSGRVGIGTSSPSETLDVAGTIVSTEFGSSGGSIALGNDSHGIFRGRSGSSDNNDLEMVTAGGGGSLVFMTNGFNEKARIDSSGNLLVGTTDSSFFPSGGSGARLGADGGANFTLSSSAPCQLNRLTNDGNVLIFRQDGTNEGSISVSGSTVSYNGGHLARWSRLPDNTDDTHIYKGTVMTNLDEMCEWRDEQGDLEDNEQLNKTTVSTQEGDPNVAGLFVAWDEDDDWGDYYLAMTGDLVVRIAQGVTVQRGDLLMSAGDGTAKPQGDDIVRSKTVAKVTSTHVSHTYPDGSYAVPCVVMAC